jgi:hypothetical protein
MRDSRKTRELLYIGIAAGLVAILGERLIKPSVGKVIKK